jgi:hypothetical protein
MRIVLQYCKKTVIHFDGLGVSWTVEGANDLGWHNWSNTWVGSGPEGYSTESLRQFRNAVRRYGLEHLTYIFRVVEVDESSGIVTRVLVDPICPRDDRDAFKDLEIPDPNTPPEPEYVAGEEEEEYLRYQEKPKQSSRWPFLEAT